MRITDSQVHLWAADSPARPWPAGGAARAQRPVPFEVGELIAEMDEAGVDRAVIVPPSWEGDRNDVALEAVKAHPDRLAVMGRIDLAQPSAVDLERWRDQPGMLGIRLTFHVGSRLDDAEWLWPLAAAAGLPLMLFGPGQTAAFGEVARRHPELRVVIDHLNLGANASVANLDEILLPLLPLGELDNVAVKLSALPLLLGPGDALLELAPMVRRVVDAFGAARCMWGSDISRLPCPYGDWVEAGRTGLGCLTVAETEQVMGEALASWLGWP